MAYTDTTLSNSIKVKAAHIKELATALQSMADAAKETIDLSKMAYVKITAVNVGYLQTAVNTLERKFSGNCCQANCCQTCQGCQSCQGCQTCQGCQSAKCQSCQKCQTCQGSKTCQSCQKCQYYKRVNCDCDCGDDGS